MTGILGSHRPMRGQDRVPVTNHRAGSVPAAARRGGRQLGQVRAAHQDPGQELLQGRGGDQERGQRQGDGPQGQAGAHDRAAH